MPRPHEETWEVTDRGACLGPVDEPGAIAEHMTGQSEQDRARLILAAQAPAMARLLLELGERRCPICEWSASDNHHPECRYAAVLRAAGVL
jgi:hypothetical protein